MGSPVVYFEIISDSSDPRALADFYSELFGWSCTEDSEDYVDVDTRTSWGIGGGIGASPGGRTVTLYVAVDDVEATLEAAEDLGGKAVTEATEEVPGAITLADVADSEGNVLSLVQSGPLADRSEAGGEHPVVYFEILASDWVGVRDFWVNLFEWDTNEFPDYHYSIIQAEAPGIGGGIGKSQSGYRQVAFYVLVTDPQAILDRAEELGGSTIKAPFGDPDGQQFAQFADPEGNVVGLVT
jgi:uncharacterized protein